MSKSKGNSLWAKITQEDQYRAVRDLVSESHAEGAYYSLLILSSVIIAAGLLLANSAILIGGMLVTPVLTPILALALGVTTAKPRLIKQTTNLILKSVAVIFVVAFIASLIFGIPEDREFFSQALFNDTIKAAFLYFIVAFASGLAATFAWIRKEVSNVLPGISIAVSLVPPISLVAIWLAQAEFDLSRFFLMIFLFNLFGIIMSSMIVFSMMEFYRSDKHITDSIDKINGKDEEEKKPV